jgi:hypothetical protein
MTDEAGFDDLAGFKRIAVVQMKDDGIGPVPSAPCSLPMLR